MKVNQNVAHQVSSKKRRIQIKKIIKASETVFVQIAKPQIIFFVFYINTQTNTLKIFHILTLKLTVIIIFVTLNFFLILNKQNSNSFCFL